MQRVQDNIVNSCERRLLTWICSVTPEGVAPDHMTLVGVSGAVIVCAGYALSHLDPRYLWMSAVGYALNWFGASMHGSLARHRRIARPRYAYFLDQSVDAFCILLMIGGMGLSPCLRMDVALLVVVGYFALSIHVFLKNHVTGTFQLSFLAIGPTELRLGFAAVTIWMYVQGPVDLRFGTVVLSSYDVVMLGLAAAFLSVFAISTAAMVLALRTVEGDGRRPAWFYAGRRADSPWSAIDPLRDRRSIGIPDGAAF